MCQQSFERFICVCSKRRVNFCLFTRDHKAAQRGRPAVDLAQHKSARWAAASLRRGAMWLGVSALPVDPRFGEFRDAPRRHSRHVTAQQRCRACQHGAAKYFWLNRAPVHRRLAGDVDEHSGTRQLVKLAQLTTPHPVCIGAAQSWAKWRATVVTSTRWRCLSPEAHQDKNITSSCGYSTSNNWHLVRFEESSVFMAPKKVISHESIKPAALSNFTNKTFPRRNLGIISPWFFGQ